MVQDSAGSGLMAAGLSNGQVILFEQAYQTSWPGQPACHNPGNKLSLRAKRHRVYSPVVAAIEQLTVADSENKLLIAASVGGELDMAAYLKDVNFLTEEVTLEKQTLKLPRVAADISQMLIDPDQRWLYVATKPDQLILMNVADIESPFRHSQVDLTEGSETVTELQFLLGGISLLVGDSGGTISQWFMVREDGSRTLKKIRSFRLGSEAIERIIPEHRRKGFVAIDTSGFVGAVLHHGGSCAAQATDVG